jgi:hypothetical protein
MSGKEHGVQALAWFWRLKCAHSKEKARLKPELHAFLLCRRRQTLRLKVVCLGLALPLSICAQQAMTDPWAIAEQKIVRLSPSAFPKLPRDVSRYLAAQGLKIPQSFAVTAPHNVVSGQFRKRGQTDYAVLASRDGVSSILVFWNGSPRHMAKLATIPDRYFLQDIGQGKIGFSRRISKVGKKFIQDRYHWYGGPEPPPITHEAINDGFVEKASTVRYFNGQKWIELQGADSSALEKHYGLNHTR